MISVYFDPLDKNYKSVTGAAEEGERIIFRIAVSGAGNCALFVCKDGEEPTEYKAERQDDLFRFSVNLKSGLYFYFFTVDGVFVGRGKRGAAEINSTERYQLTVYKKTESPSRFYGGIMYQIFPDRFFRAEGYGNADGKRLKEKWGDTPDYLPDSFGKIRNDDFFGGNFEGIREKAEYLARLGVTAIYLNPVFKARSNHRYDTGDYFKFDPLLGTEEDFKRLIHTMHTRGIAVVLDGVFNHTGDDSVYFNKYGNYPSVGAYQSQKSEFYPWYDFSEYPEKYASWWGIETLPSVKKDCAAFQRFIAGDGGVLDKYFSLGIDGIRLDVADELSDGFLDIINERVKKYGVEKIIIGEVWEDATNKIAYGKRRRYFQGGELDSVMNYPLKDAIISFVLNGDADALAETVKEQIDHYPRFALANLMNVLGTHDTARILTVLGKNGKTETERSEKAAAEMSEDLPETFWEFYGKADGEDEDFEEFDSFDGYCRYIESDYRGMKLQDASNVQLFYVGSASMETQLINEGLPEDCGFEVEDAAIEQYQCAFKVDGNIVSYYISIYCYKIDGVWYPLW